jgi:hypothetical protein
MKKGFSANPERSKAIASAVSKLREGNIDLSSYVDGQGAPTSTQQYSQSTFVQYIRYEKTIDPLEPGRG